MIITEKKNAKTRERGQKKGAVRPGVTAMLIWSLSFLGGCGIVLEEQLTLDKPEQENAAD